MKFKIYVDGQEGTTGLRINERLQNREDIEILKIKDELRKDLNERKKLINASDFTFLCLPDVAAKEAVELIESNNNKTRIIDASTAHRTNPDWAYGIPELSPLHREKIKNSNRVSVPGCYASGFAALVYPLVEKGIIPHDFPIYCHAVSGYSGAGKKAISDYESDSKPYEYNSPRAYALGQEHKHITEMKYSCGLEYAPMFNPIINDFYSGMSVFVPLQTRLLPKKLEASDISEIYKEHYDSHYGSYKGNSMIKSVVCDNADFLAANRLSGKDYMNIYATGNSERILLTAILDNLGKGASGAAVQCMNIMMGTDEDKGLVI